MELIVLTVVYFSAMVIAIVKGYHEPAFNSIAFFLGYFFGKGKHGDKNSDQRKS